MVSIHEHVLANKTVHFSLSDMDAFYGPASSYWPQPLVQACAGGKGGAPGEGREFSPHGRSPRAHVSPDAQPQLREDPSYFHESLLLILNEC